MSEPAERTCVGCDYPLPSGSRSTRRYCTATCQKRTRRRRIALATDQGESTATRWHLDDLHKQLSKERAQREREKITSQKRLAEIQHLEREVANRDRYIQQQAQRNAAATRGAASLRIELDTLRAEHQALAAIDPAEVEQLRAHLEEGRSAYQQLRKQYADMSASLHGAVKERESLQNVVRQWDRLCRRLNEQTNGKPRTEKDQDTLATWHAFRKQLGKTSTAPKTNTVRARG